MEKFAINIGPGQTWDVLFSWHDAEDYSPANPVPVTVPSLANSVIGTFYSGSPYLGRQEALPTGTPTLNQCGEYYIISPQPRPVPDHLLGRQHDRADHLHADRPARPLRLRMREAGRRCLDVQAGHEPVLQSVPVACVLAVLAAPPVRPLRPSAATRDDRPVRGQRQHHAARRRRPSRCGATTLTNGPVTRPGGPTIEVTEGDTVHVTLHNKLGAEDRPAVPGPAMAPDRTGAAARRRRRTYTFTAAAPGTFLYEAGRAGTEPAPAQYQAAMGLHGALVVAPGRRRPGLRRRPRPSTTRRCWCSARSTPRSTTPPTRPASTCARYAPRYFLVNGKTYPNTDPIPSRGRTRRCCCATSTRAVQYHSMAVLGARQTVVALDGSPLDFPPHRTSPRPSVPARPPTRWSPCRPPRPRTPAGRLRRQPAAAQQQHRRLRRHAHHARRHRVGPGRRHHRSGDQQGRLRRRHPDGPVNDTGRGGSTSRQPSTTSTRWPQAPARR